MGKSKRKSIESMASSSSFGKRRRTGENRGRKKKDDIDTVDVVTVTDDRSTTGSPSRSSTTNNIDICTTQSDSNNCISTIVISDNNLPGPSSSASSRKLAYYSSPANASTSSSSRTPVAVLVEPDSVTTASALHATQEEENEPISSSSEPNLKPKPGDSEYCIVQIGQLKHLLQNCNIRCQSCQLKHKANSIDVDTGRCLGYSVELQLYCTNCSTIISKVWSSPQLLDIEPNPTRSPHEINRRAVLAMSEVGIGNVGLNKITGIMNIYGGLHHKTYSSVNKGSIHPAIAHNSSITILKEAHSIVRRVYCELDPSLSDESILDIAVSYDGSWQKRGHTSNYGVGFVIEALTGLILDYGVRSKYCTECELIGNKIDDEHEKQIWLESHACDKNFEGPSGNMEADIALELWNRSVEACGFRYIDMIGDGDCKTLDLLNEQKVYGDDMQVNKEECINHIHKRMYKGLDALASDAKAKNIKYRGKGLMTKDRMKRWSSYYRNAIVSNTPNVENMERAVWAILFHSCSSFDNPHHSYCGEAWCWYKIAVKEGRNLEEVKSEKELDPPLPNDLGELLVPLFRRLADKKLLGRCTRSQTQNANECLHSVIWTKIPKIKFVSKTTLETGIALAASEFNKGASVIADTASVLGFEPGKMLQHLVTKTDVRRINGSDRAAQTLSKAARKAKETQKAKQTKECQTGDQFYSAGMF